jgi:putative oxygen-independent coproporphyrinogen III oxidase
MAVPLSLYVHLPWCVRKCPYCDFNSYTAPRETPVERYVDALLVDIEAEAARAEGRKPVSVFFGGGTPSLFPPPQIARLVTAIRERFGIGEDVEVTLEANPGTVERGDPAGFLAAGVNRLSIGAQSFDADRLRILGRIHSVPDIALAVEAARAAGFEDLNLDLMYALPGQDPAAALADIDAAAALGATHISWYQLTLEPNTVFHSRPPAGLPDEDAAAEIEARGRARLAELGFERYEVSAYAREGRRCRHNLNYWTFGDYLAVGAGAHGKISTAAGVWRYAKPAHPLSYMEAIERAETAAALRPVPAADRLFEFMLNALRLTEGFDTALFRERTGLPGEDLESRLVRPVDKGLIGRSPDGRWYATALGQRFLDDLVADFLPGDGEALCTANRGGLVFQGASDPNSL